MFDFKNLNGRWDEVIKELSGHKLTKKPGQPCPFCGGNDRFHYSDAYDNGTWICRHCQPEGGTGLVFLSKALGKTTSEVAKLINQRYGQTEIKKIKVVPKGLQPIIPCPEELSRLEDLTINTVNQEGTKQYAHHYKVLYAWRNVDSSLIGYLGRKPDKTTHQIYWTEKGWTQGSLGDNRPLFGLETLNKNKVLIVVEGEKTWQFVVKHCPSHAVVTWTGGAPAWKKSDWSIIKDKTVYLVPDNDEPGRKAMSNIFKQLKANNDCHMISIPANKPEHWDLADDEDIDILQFIEDNAEAPEPDVDLLESWESPELKKEIKPLGFNDGRIFVMPRNQLQIRELSMTNLGEDTLVSLASPSFWYKFFKKDDEGKINWKKARAWLLNLCLNAGTYTPSMLRGRGVWSDTGRVVAHMGDKLIVDSKEVSLVDFESDYIYIRGQKIGKVAEQPLTLEEGRFLFDICNSVNWVDRDVGGTSLAAHLLLGYIVSSQICGAMHWRTHAWITGQPGVGKSTILRDVVKVLQGRWSLYVEGDTTEAGIRQALKMDALAVIFDEPEADDDKDVTRISRIVKLCRSGSTESESAVLKGSASNDAITYAVKFQACLSSIATQLKEQADKDRWVVLDISSRNTDSSAKWKDLQAKIRKIDKGMTDRLFMRSLRELKTINTNIEILKEVITKRLGSDREGDKYAGLLACANSVLEEGIMSKEKAEKMIERLFWDFQDERFDFNGESIEERAALDILIESIIPVIPEDGSRKEYSVGEVISILARPARGMCTRPIDKHTKEPMPVTIGDLIRALAQYGIYVDYKGGMVRIAHTNKNLPKLFKEYPKLTYNWNEVFKRLRGAKKSKGQVYLGMAGQIKSCLMIPLTHFLRAAKDEDEDENE